MIDALLVAVATTAVADVGTKSATLTVNMDALAAYDSGFAHDVMRAPGDQGVILNDLVLIENDGPGAGASEKGTWVEQIHKGVLARKTLRLDHPASSEAHLVIYMASSNKEKPPSEPFVATLNGRRFESQPLSWHENMWHWLRVPVDALRGGVNTVVVECGAAPGEGYDLMIARADEYEQGGGTRRIDGSTAPFCARQPMTPSPVTDGDGVVERISVGQGSERSGDGGQTWTRGKLGATADVAGEYVIRLNLRRYRRKGVLLSPPIDLWGGVPGHEKLRPRCAVSSLRLYGFGEQPRSTGLVWQVRFADTPDMTSAQWGEFTTVGAGPSVAAELGSGEGRYLQWRAFLTTDDVLVTPVVRGVKLVRTVHYTPPANRYYVWQYENVRHRYSSVKFHYETCDTPKLNALRERLRLDEVVAGANGDWERINRVRHHVSQLWRHDSPLPGYPEWDALEILGRRDRLGHGGMCIQFSIVFIQALQSLGYQARHINVFAHETVEVYVDELGKWVHVDPESLFDSYEYHTTTGLPLNCLEQHRLFLEENRFSSERPIDWQAVEPWARWGGTDRVHWTPVPADVSTFTGWINDPEKRDYPPQHQLAGFMRMMPRNDYFSNPHPRPLTQGCTNWPWNGYVNWYDEATPRKLQYSLHTDREADFYPTLNRVEFDAVHTDTEGEMAVRMVTVAPNFDGFEAIVDGTGWRRTADEFVWTLRRAALNTLEMRVRNKMGPIGKASRIQVMAHYKEPFSPRPADWQ